MLTPCTSVQKSLFLNQMQKLIPLSILCVIAILAMIGLQVYWADKYYQMSSEIFGREVNMAFEDALKKEFGLRADTIQEAIKNKLLDTNTFLIQTTYKSSEKKMTYTIRSRNNLNEAFHAAFLLESFEQAAGSDRIRSVIAQTLASTIRNEDLENHIIYYRTQSIGKFMTELVESKPFDTTRLRPVLNAVLAQRNIDVPYTFLTRKTDNTYHQNTFPDSLLKKYPVITRSLPTYTSLPGQQYVRVLFHNPMHHILARMGLALTAALLILLLLSTCLYLLLRRLFQEKKLNALKNDFISHITHEFKTPIATAGIAVEAALSDPELLPYERPQRYLRHAKTHLDLLGDLTDQILKLTIYEQTTQLLKKEKIHFIDIIQEIANSLQQQEARNVIRLHKPSQMSILEADEVQFRHAIANVLDNALKYGTKDKGIDVHCQQEAGMLLIRIRDYGPGIPEAARPFIFDKFYRAAGHEIKGYGLGLHYVRQILTLHGGWCKAIPENPGLSIQLAWPI